MANIIIFLEKDTFLQKKSFFCHHENENPTPININNAPPLPAWLREVSRKPLQADIAVPHHVIPKLYTLFRPIDRNLSFFEQPFRLGLHHSRY